MLPHLTAVKVQLCQVISQCSMKSVSYGKEPTVSTIGLLLDWHLFDQELVVLPSCSIELCKLYF
jgi:hypothetical protein